MRVPVNVRQLAPILAIVIAVGACTPGSTVPATAAPLAIATPTVAPSVVPPATSAPSSAPTPTPPVAPTPTPTVAPTPTPTPERAARKREREPYAINLYRRGDFVAQYTFEWCVGASLQMTLNLATDDSHTSRRNQQRLWEMARDRSSSPFGGANPRGWTATLNELDVGPYELVSLPSFNDAIETAAKAIRATKRPVGLVMWRGRHAWVMSGFESTADPKHFDDFRVTGVRVLDPLYPHGSLVWGRSPKPNSLIKPKTLAKQYVIREHLRVNLGVPDGWLLVLPVSRT